MLSSGRFAAFYFVSLCLQQVLGYGPTAAGIAFLPFSAGVVAGSVIRHPYGRGARYPVAAGPGRLAGRPRHRRIRGHRPRDRRTGTAATSGTGTAAAPGTGFAGVPVADAEESQKNAEDSQKNSGGAVDPAMSRSTQG
ncbi:hypothetical protein ACIQUY_08535 [Streptomyces sp. NPDC090231]|uniref:hypothetical protein n=1 Tax=unclassified Streptomyces TaxID=2593676 RepID=UPI003805F1B9